MKINHHAILNLNKRNSYCIYIEDLFFFCAINSFFVIRAIILCICINWIYTCTRKHIRICILPLTTTYRLNNLQWFFVSSTTVTNLQWFSNDRMTGYWEVMNAVSAIAWITSYKQISKCQYTCRVKNQDKIHISEF